MPNPENLIPLNLRTPEERKMIQSMGGKSCQMKKQRDISTKYFLGKLSGVPILDKRTVAKYEKMGFENGEIVKGLEVAAAIINGAKDGNPKMVEIYLRLLGEDAAVIPEKENNLLDALLAATKEDINTDDIPELF